MSVTLSLRRASAGLTLLAGAAGSGACFHGGLSSHADEPTAVAPSLLHAYLPPDEVHALTEKEHPSDAWQIIREHRPTWLTASWRSASFARGDIVVYVDAVRMGGPATLHDIAAGDVYAIRRYSPAEADFRFGRGHTFGAINVLTVPEAGELLSGDSADHPSARPPGESSGCGSAGGASLAPDASGSPAASCRSGSSR